MVNAVSANSSRQFLQRWTLALVLVSTFILPFNIPTSSAAPSGISGSIVLGAGNYLKTIDSADFTMGANDFTFETWVHPTAPPSTSFTGIISIGMPSDLTSGINGREIRIGQSFAGDGKLGFMAPDNTGTSDVWTATSAALEIGRWTHLALVRNGSTLTLYVNGVSRASRTGVSFTHVGYAAKSNLGAFFISKNGGWGDGEFVGSVADVRLVKGTAVYLSNFAPPTAALGIVGGSNTKMLLNSNYSSGNLSADYAFNAASNNLQLTVGGSPSSSSVTPYSPLDTALNLTRSSSMSASSDVATSPLQNRTAYTVEGWVKPTSTCIGAGIRCEMILRDGDYDIVLSEGVFQYVVYFNGTSNTGFISTSYAPEANVWTHVALTRDGTAVNFYVNGILISSTTLAFATAANYANFPFRVGYAGYGVTHFDGQIDEVKLWNVARTQVQIDSTLYSAPSLTDSTLLAYYDFNTGVGSKVVNRKVGAATTSYLTLLNSPGWTDIKTQSTSGIDVTITISRAYINTFGGFTLPASIAEYDYLVVAGGGGGGNGYNNGGGGGGGGGMVLTGIGTNTPGETLSAIVGVGGAGGANAQANNSGVDGDPSILKNLTALGGGQGAGSLTYLTARYAGGAKQVSSITSARGGSGGGAGGGGGGGGGADGIGGNGVGATAGSSGSGLAVLIGAISASYGAGGAGAPGNVNFDGVRGGANTGSGGSGAAGGNSSSRAGGHGGSGIIVIHYLIGSSTLTFSHSTGSPIYRTVGTISITTSTAGKVSFYERGKIIPGCRNRPTNGSNVATCAWQPSTRGLVSILTVFKANGGASANQSTTNVMTVTSRTNRR